MGVCISPSNNHMAVTSIEITFAIIFRGISFTHITFHNYQGKESNLALPLALNAFERKFHYQAASTIGLLGNSPPLRSLVGMTFRCWRNIGVSPDALYIIPIRFNIRYPLRIPRSFLLLARKEARTSADICIWLIGRNISNFNCLKIVN